MIAIIRQQRYMEVQKNVDNYTIQTIQCLNRPFVFGLHSLGNNNGNMGYMLIKAIKGW